MHMVFKAEKLVEITKGVSIDGEERRCENEASSLNTSQFKIWGVRGNQQLAKEVEKEWTLTREKPGAWKPSEEGGSEQPTDVLLGEVRCRPQADWGRAAWTLLMNLTRAFSMN